MATWDSLPFTINIVADPGSNEQGRILYYNGSAWTGLDHGTSGQYLKTGGHGSNPSWDTPSSGSTSAIENRVQNGSFEIVLSSGRPLGWTQKGTATITTDTGERDGYGGSTCLKVTSAGTNNEGVTQTLKHLRPSTTYYFRARGKVTSGDTGKISTTGGSSNASVTFTDTSFADVTGTFTTDSTPTDIVVQIGSDNNTDVVYVDHLTIDIVAPTQYISDRYEFIKLPAGSWDYPATNPAPLDTRTGTYRNRKAHMMDQSTEEFVVSPDILIPHNINPGGEVLFLSPVWAATAAADKYCQLKVYHCATACATLAGNEDWDGADYGSVSSGDIALDASQDYAIEAKWGSLVSALAWNTWENLSLKLSRIAPSGTNLTGDLCCGGLWVYIPVI